MEKILCILSPELVRQFTKCSSWNFAEIGLDLGDLLVEHVEEYRSNNDNTIPSIQMKDDATLSGREYRIEFGAEIIYGNQTQQDFMKTIGQTWSRYCNYEYNNTNYENAVQCFQKFYNGVQNINLQDAINCLYQFYFFDENKTRQIDCLLSLSALMYHSRDYQRGDKCLNAALDIVGTGNYLDVNRKHSVYMITAYACALHGQTQDSINALSQAYSLNITNLDLKVQTLALLIHIQLTNLNLENRNNMTSILNNIEKLHELIHNNQKYINLISALADLSIKITQMAINKYCNSVINTLFDNSVINTLFNNFIPQVIWFLIGKFLTGNTFIGKNQGQVNYGSGTINMG